MEEGNTKISKTTLIISAVAIVLLVGVIVYTHRSARNVVPPPVSENTPVPTNTAQWPSAKQSDQNINDNGSYYNISATYPVVKDDVITGYFKTFVQDSITQFKSDTSWAAGTGASTAPAEADGLSLTITYKEEKNNNADNFVFNSDVYTGGAHDLQSTKTFSFSPTGQLILLSSLFTNGNAGLSTIAPYVQKQLSTIQYADTDMIKEGTAPTPDNYASFTVQSDGVTFIFDPYDVAPYAAGTQTVKVPISVFKAIANPGIFK
ncbi:MAG TPA: DUF3298 domain-containing protein [Candidatus Paceibacterota bacterium]|jgi:hypothetical protein|nr:DUF3298 domain-containing protein [Candidatus Paceibacterota bacterium]